MSETAVSRDAAWALFTEWTASESLRAHVLAVEAGMRAYARIFDEDEERWAATGILHDLDYERYPDLETGHPRVAVEELRRRGYPEDVIEAIEGHADYLGVPRTAPMARALYAVDELSGFVAACARVRPDGIHGLTPKSVKKKLKAPSFAAGVDRDGVRRGAATAASGSRPSSGARSSIAAITRATCSSKSTPSSSAPRATSSRPTPAAKLGCLSFFFTDFGVSPSRPVGRTRAHAATKPESSSTA